ncbi:MAG: GspE/PulE family protein [Pseudomonadota bacterium]
MSTLDPNPMSEHESEATADPVEHAAPEPTIRLRLHFADGARREARLMNQAQDDAELELAEPEQLPTVGQRLLVERLDGANDSPPQPAEVSWRGAPERPVVGVRFVSDKLLDSDTPQLDIARVKVDPQVALQLPAARARQWQVLPFATSDDSVMVAATSPLVPKVETVLNRAFRREIKPHMVDADALSRVIDRVYAGADALALGTAGPAEGELDAVATYDLVFASALMYGASDIHIDSFQNRVRIRVRVDGQIETLRDLTPESGTSLISRIKVMAGLDISERRAPQDGRLRHEMNDDVRLDVRVATLPTKHGERVTLRLLGKDADDLSLGTLGMSPTQLEHFGRAIRQPYGMILLTGPTGSGKSTTLFAAIQQLISETDLNVITIEDPVEYQIAGVTQVEVDPAEKVTFAKAMRSTLRHDPDVVMIGEIRDSETADIAVKAALTGHLVLSTLHTNDAAGAITRLIDMGVPSYLVGATLRMVVAQRLVRRLCSSCATPAPCDPAHAAVLGRPDLAAQMIKEPVGCLYCGHRGYTGRLALFEMLTCDRELSRLITANATEGQIKSHIDERGLATLADDAAEKLQHGRTSISDVLRNVVSFADLTANSTEASGDAHLDAPDTDRP